MRKNRPTRRSGRSPFTRLFGGPAKTARKAPRRRELERLEERQMLAVVGSPTDEPYFHDQWHLQASGQLVEQPNSPTFQQSKALIDINVLGAWNLGYTGAGVQVAVVDDGFDINHEDLTFTLLVGENGEVLDVIGQDNDPGYEIGEYHGTAVSGLIGARDNGIGMIGVAYGADIVPIRFLATSPDEEFNYNQAQALTYLQYAGIPSPGDDYFAQTDQIVEIFNRSYQDSTASRQATPLSPEVRLALETAAVLGRGTWLDLDGDGLYETSEIRALGSINIIASGNAGGGGVIDPFTDVGIYASSQYYAEANSRHTITVGAVDFDGSYENVATGARGSFAEAGANLLIVAPSNTAVIGGTGAGAAGVWTTDVTDDDGYNVSPVFGAEFDGDYFVDTNYTSTFGGTSASTPIVSGVVALMLEANPNLSYRDVQQILLMSAQQVDQFDESWIVNPFKYFEDTYEIPQYLYHDLDTDMDPSTVEVEDAIIPNYTSPDYVRGFFFNDPDMDVPLAGAATNDLSAFGIVSISGEPDPVLAWGPNFNPGNVNALGYLLNPISSTEKGYSLTGVNSDLGDVIVQPFDPLINGELQFENGVGFTVSHGYGDYLEEYGYAHGMVDATLAVQLAAAWGTYSEHLTEEVTITTSIEGGTAPIRVQPRGDVGLGGGANFEIPGGISQAGDINTDWYAQWLESFEWSNVQFDGNDVGSVITGGPWYNPTGQLNGLLQAGTGRGDSRLTFRIDPSIAEDWMSIEWIDFTTQIVSGDVDSLRISIISPDGTQTELDPFRLAIDGSGDIPQQTQTQQGVGITGADEILGEDIGGYTIDDFIDGSERELINEIDLEDGVPAGTSWTWTTNRHWGELFSTEAQNFDNPNSSVEGQWYMVFENWGDAAVEFGGQFEIQLHGTRATGNRIQGKIGVDDNKQGREGQNNDQLFNFDRNITFGEVTIDGLNHQVVIDDATDSVHYNNNYYETVDDSTGRVFRYAVVDQLEYRAFSEILKGELASPGTSRLFYETLIANGLNASFGTPMISEAEAFEWYFEYGEDLALTSVVDPFTGDTNGDGITDETDVLVWYAELYDRVAADLAAAETYEPLLQYNIVPGTSSVVASTDSTGNAFTYQNWDYNQESFASNVTVQATQYAVTYDSQGVVTGRSATGVVDYFTTGADGNYWFDVEASPEPPNPLDYASVAAFDAAMAVWMTKFGVTYDYEISLVGSNAQDRIIDHDYSAEESLPSSEVVGGLFGAVVERGGAAVTYQTGDLLYNVSLYASPQHEDGQATVVKDINFLLTVDPALTNVDTSGTVYRDRNGDGIQQSVEESLAGVTVFHDADNDGVLDAGETFAVTNANGTYELTIAGLTTPQNATIRVDLSTVDPSLTPLNPTGAVATVAVTPGQPVAQSFTFQLSVGEPAQVYGFVFEDVDQDGVRDAGEQGFSDTDPVIVYIDVNNDGVYDVGEPSDEVGSDGSFLIESDSTGSFRVRINLPDTQLSLTTPSIGYRTVSLESGKSVDLGAAAFGVYDGRISDFGDLWVDGTHNYPTLLADNGARHVVAAGTRLGALIDIDVDGPTVAPGFGDDYDNLDDEDGVTLVTTEILPSSTIEFDVLAFGNGAVLNAWIDFNNDGDWDDAGEHVFVDVEDLATTAANPMAARISAATPADVDTDAEYYAARFRWGPAGISYTGVANRGEVEDYLFYSADPIVVTGAVRSDVDGDATFEATDTAVAGARVFYDVDLDGVLDPGEPRAVTDASGAYRLEINTTEASLDVTLRLDLSTIDPSLQPLVPVDGIFSRTIVNGGAATANYLVAKPQGLTGVVFDDLDNDGVHDESEGGFAGLPVRVYADTNSDGVYETLVNSTTTNANGAYTFTLEVVGTYQVRLDLSGEQFVTQTLPAGGAARNANVVAGTYVTVGEFGVFDAVPTFTHDFGDLIVGGSLNFPTTLADDGARHPVGTGVYLGATAPDADPGTLQSSNATADDFLFSDDEDGVKMASDIASGADALIDVTATGGSANRLHAWIDFNNDGDWDDAGEQITAAGGLGLTSGVTTQLVIDTTGIDIDATASAYAARFRWGEGITGYTGEATSGEVEDYLLPRVRVTTGGIDVVGDFNGDDLVTQADYDVWKSTYGSTTNLAADANRNGKVDAADYSIWRDALATASPAFLVAQDEADEVVYLNPLSVDPAGVPPLMQMPIDDSVEESVSFNFGVYAPMLMVGPEVASSLDESLATADDAPSATDDAIDSALLEWSLGSAYDAPSDDTAGTHREAQEDDEVEETEEAFASVFAF